MLDAYSRRHEAHKTVLKQRAAQRWISARQNILRGMPPNASTYPVLATLDDQLRLVSLALRLITNTRGLLVHIFGSQCLSIISDAGMMYQSCISKYSRS